MGGIIKSLLNFSYDFWNTVVGVITGMLTMNPSAFMGGAPWTAVERIMRAIQVVAQGLMPLFFIVGLAQKTVNFDDLKRPQTFFKHLLRLMFAYYIVMHGADIITALFGVGAQLVGAVSGSTVSAISLPGAVTNAIDDAGLLTQIGLLVIAVLAMIAIVVLAVTVLMTVFSRFFKLFMYTALSPIPLAGFAGESTTFMGVSFLRSLGGVMVEGAAMMVAVAIWASVVNSSAFTTLFPANYTDAPGEIVLFYTLTTIVSLLVLSATLKATDTYVKKLTGLDA